MSYATVTDMNMLFGEDEITQLSDRDLDGSNDVDVVETALTDATSEINSYLGVRYDIPVVSVSDWLKRVCCDIARFFLHDDAATEEVEKRYKNALSWLRDVAAGRAVLTDDSGTPVDSGGTSVGVKFSSNERKFTDDSMAGF